jgi:hypothetical protein
LRKQILREDRRFRRCIRDLAAQLRGDVHRIRRHRDRAAAPHRVRGDDELRAVLHEQQHAIAFGDGEVLLQEARQRIDLLFQFRVAECGAVIDDRGFAWVALGGDVEVGHERSRRHG